MEGMEFVVRDQIRARPLPSLDELMASPVQSPVDWVRTKHLYARFNGYSEIREKFDAADHISQYLSVVEARYGHRETRTVKEVRSLFNDAISSLNSEVMMHLLTY
jgi:hypothetical protein